MDEPFEAYPESDGHSIANLLLGIGLGVLIGAAAAALLAPQSGADTRDNLHDLSNRVKERADEMIAELKQNLDELSAKSREIVDTARDRVDAAIQAGKVAAEEKRTELEAQVHPGLEAQVHPGLEAPVQAEEPA